MEFSFLFMLPGVLALGTQAHDQFDRQKASFMDEKETGTWCPGRKWVQCHEGLFARRTNNNNEDHGLKAGDWKVEAAQKWGTGGVALVSVNKTRPILHPPCDLLQMSTVS